MSSIQVLGKALRLLEVLALEKSGVSLGFLSKRLDLPRSTVQRLVDTLAEEGWVQKGAGDASLTLGMNCLRLGLMANASGPMDYLKKVLHNLHERTRETVTCARLVEGKIQIVASIESPEFLRVAMIPPDQIPVQPSSIGQVLLGKELAYDREACAPGICSVAIRLPIPGPEILALGIVAPALRYYQHEAAYTNILRETVAMG